MWLTAGTTPAVAPIVTAPCANAYGRWITTRGIKAVADPLESATDAPERHDLIPPGPWGERGRARGSRIAVAYPAPAHASASARYRATGPRVSIPLAAPACSAQASRRAAAECAAIPRSPRR